MPALFIVLAIILLGAAVPIALAAKDNHGDVDNNPGNLEDLQPIPIQWVGRIGYIPRVVDGHEWRATKFDTLENGCRALMRNAIRQYEKLKADPLRPETLYEFGEIWAPTGHGGNANYGMHLAITLGVGQDARFDFIGRLKDLAGAIILNERGPDALASVPPSVMESARVKALTGTQFQSYV